MASDWRFNFDLTNGRVRCHLKGDIVRGLNQDWARISGAAYLLQKLVIYFAIPKGEIINEPNMGTCLHNYIFDKITSTVLSRIEVEMEAELQEQIPELGVNYVTAEFYDQTKTAIKLSIVGFNTWIFQIFREDLLDINLIDIFGGGVEE